MRAYAIAHIREITMGPAVVEYLDRIDATLAPFGGRFVIHGGNAEVLEGTWRGDLIAIEFPDRDRLVPIPGVPGDAAPHRQLKWRLHRGRRRRRRAPGA